MKKIAKLSFLSILLASCNARNKEAVNNLEALDLISKVQTDIIFEKAKNLPNGTHLSFALVDGARTQYIDVKRENDTLSVIGSQDYVFEIGSISKVFTSTLLADAVIKQEVALDDPIAIPLKDNIQISYKQLSNHTSGLPGLPKNIFSLASFRTDNPYKDYNKELLESYLRDEVELDNAPGEKNAYSNLGAGLLGHLLSKKSGSSYEELLQQRVFSKYGMTFSTSDIQTIQGNLVLGLDKKGEITSNWDLASLKGAGGIYATAGDLAKFVKAHFYKDDEVLTLSRKRTFTVNSNMDMALGWHIINTKSGDTWYFHNGGTGGYTSSMAMDVENKNAVIVLTNVSALSKLQKQIDPLCFELMKALKK